MCKYYTIYDIKFDFWFFLVYYNSNVVLLLFDFKKRRVKMKDNPFVTNNKNKIRLSFLISGLALVLMLAFSGTLFLSNKNAQAAVSYWTNSSYRASSYAGGTGTSSNPYKITNGKELALMAYHVNKIKGYASKYYSLQNNVSLVAPDKNGNQLVWEPIGTSSIFTGSFLGNGHTISGLYINQTTSDYAGLFGQVSGNVESLRVEGTIMLKKSTKYVGGIIAKKTGTYTTSKLTSNVNIMLSVDTVCNYVGGVVGHNTYIISQCMSLGTIVGHADHDECYGGIVGFSSGVITDCYNKGDLSGEFTNDDSNGVGYNFVGGIAGKIESTTIKNCFNLGSINKGSGIVDFAENCVRISKCYNKGTIWDGSGIAAYIKNTTNQIIIEDTYNLGTVYHGMAGLVGKIESSSKFTINNCYNKANIIDPFTANRSYSGGLIGLITSQEVFDITNCFNSGTLATRVNYSFARAGGIIGYVSVSTKNNSKGKISDCKNTGRIAFTSGTTENPYKHAVGGIIGGFQGCTMTLSNLLNQGEVSGTYYAGGIIGDFGSATDYSTYADVINCVNYGPVSGSENVGGIIGIYYPGLSAGTGNFMRCINFGNIKGIKNGSECIGGIVGYFYTRASGNTISIGGNWRLGGASVSHSINYGTINYNYNCTNVGGIVGYFDSRELKSGQAKNFVQNCLSVGMVYPNSSSYKNDHYVGSMVGRNVKDAGYMKNIGYYCSDIAIKAFGTKSRKSIDDSNGTAYSRTLSEILTSSFVGDWSTWCEYKTRSSLKNDKLQDAITKVEAAYDKTMSGLVLLKNIDYDGLKLNFDFMDTQTSSPVWAKDNPNINNGEPYFKDRYW